MPKKLGFLATFVLLAIGSPAMAINLYVGGDAEFRYMNFQKGFGDNLFNHNYPQANLYAGLRLNEYLAVEGGYEASERKTRTTTLRPGDISFGFIIPPNYNPQFNTVAQLKALNANVVGTVPISDRYRLQLIGSVGFARLKAKMVSAYFALDNYVQPPRIDTFIKRKSVLRLGAGIQHRINSNWGVRAMLKWENSNKLRLSNKETLNRLARPQNSLMYSFGLFYHF